MMKPSIILLSAIGAISILFALKNVLQFIYIHFLRRSSISRYLLKLRGETPWAIVTGATHGIGLAYAHELASLGFNVIIQGRNKTQLGRVLYELQVEHPKQKFQIMVLDATRAGKGYEFGLEIADRFDDLEGRSPYVTVLVNTIGAGIKEFGPIMQAFEAEDERDLDLLIDVNARFLVQFTHDVLSLMTWHSNPALIINMGSVTEFGIPYLSTYSALKGFNMCFSRALRSEMLEMYKGKVEVLGVMAPASGVTGRELAKKALGMVGCGFDVVLPLWTHDLLWKTLKNCPAWVMEKEMVRLSVLMLNNSDLTEKRV